MRGNLPDKIIMFKTDLETLKNRTGQKKLDGIELRGLDYLLQVQEIMIETVKKIGIPYQIIDARETQTMIHKKITKYLNL